MELALQNASLDERKRYAHGSELNQSGANPSPDSQDSKDLHFYVKTHDALLNLSRGSNPTPGDITDDPKPDATKYLQDTLGMSAADIEKYKSDAAFRKTFDDKTDGLNYQVDKLLSHDLLNQLATSGDITNLSRQTNSFMTPVVVPAPHEHYSMPKHTCLIQCSQANA